MPKDNKDVKVMSREAAIMRVADCFKCLAQIQRTEFCLALDGLCDSLLGECTDEVYKGVEQAKKEMSEEKHSEEILVGFDPAIGEDKSIMVSLRRMNGKTFVERVDEVKHYGNDPLAKYAAKALNDAMPVWRSGFWGWNPGSPGQLVMLVTTMGRIDDEWSAQNINGTDVVVREDRLLVPTAKQLSVSIGNRPTIVAEDPYGSIYFHNIQTSPYLLPGPMGREMADKCGIAVLPRKQIEIQFYGIVPAPQAGE